MKKYICEKCIAYGDGGGLPCTLYCDDDLKPTHCPHDDSAYPHAAWTIASKETIEFDFLPKVLIESLMVELLNKHQKHDMYDGSTKTPGDSFSGLRQG